MENLKQVVAVVKENCLGISTIATVSNQLLDRLIEVEKESKSNRIRIKSLEKIVADLAMDKDGGRNTPKEWSDE